MEVLLHSFYIFTVLFLIVFACVIFTNAIEHLGEKLNLSEGAVGSVLAAVGTALPETIVPLVAIIGAYLSGQDLHQGQEIGIGGILGAPFLLGTLAFFVIGFAVLFFARKGQRSKDIKLNPQVMFRDFKYFAIGYYISILAAFIPIPQLKPFVALILFIVYGTYVFNTIRDKSQAVVEDVGDLDILYLTKFINFPKAHELFYISLQVLISLLGIIFLAHFFVSQIKFFATTFHLNPLILSLLLTPIATELPEKFNSVIWIRAKKDTLAMGNVTGAMVFQSCIPTSVGIILTPWVLGANEMINVIVLSCSVLTVYLAILKNKAVITPQILMTGGFFYLLYIIYVVLFSMGLIPQLK
jgi:cation:H+ antiporter